MIEPVITNAIPLELRKLRQWVCWTYLTKRGDKPTKTPINPHNRQLAKSDDERTWATYRDAARAAAIAGIGIGFVFTASDPFCGIDLDGCVSNSIINPAAQALVDSLATYTEVSPSGNGLKIFLRGRKTVNAGCSLGGKNAALFGSTRIEIYSSLRFFTVTGKYLGVTTVEDRQPELTTLCNQLWPPRPVHKFTAPNNIPVTNREKRCAAYVRKCCPAAISGQGGHNATLRVACEAFRFGLDEQAAMRILEMFNESKCVPPWNTKELQHKIEHAYKKVSAEGMVGVRLERRAS